MRLRVHVHTFVFARGCSYARLYARVSVCYFISDHGMILIALSLPEVTKDRPPRKVNVFNELNFFFQAIDWSGLADELIIVVRCEEALKEINENYDVIIREAGERPEMVCLRVEHPEQHHPKRMKNSYATKNLITTTESWRLQSERLFPRT